VANSNFICPGCKRNIGVPAELIGRWIECPISAMWGFAAMPDDPPSQLEDAPRRNANSKKLIPGALVLLDLSESKRAKTGTAPISWWHPNFMNDEKLI